MWPRALALTVRVAACLPAPHAMLVTALAIAALALEARGQRIDFGGITGEVTDLPGLEWSSGVDFKMYSGYIPVGANGKTFYWFVESQLPTSATDPVLLWTNGGPGCSGLVGMLSEQGPFRAEKDGTLGLNEFSWNSVANMVFIEQPVGVGFSVASNGDIKYGDAQAAADNLEFVKGFFEKFSMLKSNKFYITSESYGGHYMPTLAAALVGARSAVPNFGGFMVGNPLTYMPYRDYGEFATFYGHQLLPKPLWEKYLAANCSAVPPALPGDECPGIQQQMENITSGFDGYALDFPKCNDATLAVGRHERWAMRNTVRRARAARLGSPGRQQQSSSRSLELNPNPGPYFPVDYMPCTSDWAATFLSRADVQAAVHATPGGPTWKGNWSACSDAVGNAFNVTDVNAPMMPVYAELLQSAVDLNILVYSGDDDSVCATRGSQQWVWDLGLPIKGEPWQACERSAVSVICVMACVNPLFLFLSRLEILRVSTARQGPSTPAPIVPTTARRASKLGASSPSGRASPSPPCTAPATWCQPRARCSHWRS